MNYVVHAIVTEIVSIEVEADSEEQAQEIASEAGRTQWDAWSYDINYTSVWPR